ncbi:CAP domain-containing protein [Actinacidiphila sp. bgisy167]|uniref:CAP domain-containing protein n=1 Tax=Actinacidiphila sp. bgisy167 TaxID=3413797 RepID=UPI003D744392
MSSHRKRRRARRAPSARSWPLAAAVATVAAGSLVGAGAQFGNDAGGKEKAFAVAGDRADGAAPVAAEAPPETAVPSPGPTAVSPSASTEPRRREPTPRHTRTPTASATPTRTVVPSTTGVTKGPTTAATTATATADGEDPVVAQIVRLVNDARASAGCRPVTLEERLTEAAQDYTDVMARSGVLSHTGPDGSTMAGRVEAAGYRWSTLGENIAVGQRTAADVMDAWMHSEGHRANILNCAFEQIGVGVNTTSGGPWWTQDFGTPR